MKVWYDVQDFRAPKRGDLLQSNIGHRRERTWLVLRSVRAKRRTGRYHLWVERWWELEPDFRMRLFSSAERAGGQQLFRFYRYPSTKRRTSLC